MAHTSSMIFDFPVITVSTLREVLNRWPDHGSGKPSLVMLGSTHSDLGDAPLPAVAASSLHIHGSDEEHLTIYPQKAQYDFSTGATDDVLDMALEALTYAGSVSIDEFDPFVDNALRIRAINAIMTAQALNRKFKL